MDVRSSGLNISDVGPGICAFLMNCPSFEAAELSRLQYYAMSEYHVDEIESRLPGSGTENQWKLEYGVQEPA